MYEDQQIGVDPRVEEEKRKAALAAQLPAPPTTFSGAQAGHAAAPSGSSGPNWGEGAKGALGGAATGAAVGSVVPVVGTALGAGIGGVVGGIGGLFSSHGGPDKAQPLKDELAAGQGTRAVLAGQLDQFQSRQAPQMSPVGPVPATQMQAPTMQAANTADAGVARAAFLAPSVNATAGQTAGVERMGAAQVGSATPMNAANVRGPVSAGAAQIDSTRESGARAGQARLATGLEAAANGQGGPSAAETMLGTALAKQTAAQMAMANSARGASAGRALRTAQINTGNAQTEAAGQLATLRAQEQMNARGQLAGALQGMRGQDVDVAGQNAQFGQQAGLANAAAGNQVNLAAMSNEQQANQFNANAEAERLRLQATLGQQAALTNAGAANEAMQAQAQRDTGVSVANAGNANDMAKAQAGLTQGVSLQNAASQTQTSQFNAGQSNNRQDLAAQLMVKVGEGNRDAVNTFALETSKIGLQASLANLEATLKARGLDDQYIAQLRNDLVAMHGQGIQGASALASKPTGPTFSDKLMDTGADLGMAYATGKLK